MYIVEAVLELGESISHGRGVRRGWRDGWMEEGWVVEA